VSSLCRGALAAALTLVALCAQAAEPPPPQPTEPLHPAFAPLVLPASLLAPGSGHLLRGEKRTGLRMLVLAGGTYTLAGGAALGLVLSGAADQLVVPLVPLTLLALSVHLSLTSADMVGAFGSASQPLAEAARQDVWSAPARVRLGYLYAPNSVFGQAHFLELSGERRWPGGWLGVQLGSDARGEDLIGGLSGGVRLLAFEEAEPSGLFLEGSARHEHYPDGGFDALRLRAGLGAVLPLGRLAPTLAPLTSMLRVGLQPVLTRFRPSGSWRSTLELAGGFDLRWTLHPRVRATWGYEHAREGVVGGVGFGFTGVFSAGLEVQVARGLWLAGQGLLGTPRSAQLALERRW
jgi:hypothetical protein